MLPLRKRDYYSGLKDAWTLLLIRIDSEALAWRVCALAEPGPARDAWVFAAETLEQLHRDLLKEGVPAAW